MPENDASLQARMLCLTLGIVGWRKEFEIAERIKWVAGNGSVTAETARSAMVTAYERYKEGRGDLEWVYASPYAFLMGDIWNDDSLWPWKPSAPRGATVGMCDAPDIPAEEVERLRASIAAKREAARL